MNNVNDREDNANRTKPITPNQVFAVKRASVPTQVFAAFNSLIVERFNGHEARFGLDTIIEAILIVFAKDGLECPMKTELIERHWLDVEDTYREAGWEVIYEKSGHNESQSMTFTFRPNGRNK